jgi:hypothetical protein
MTARGVARMYSALLGYVDGITLVSSQRRAAMAAVAVTGMDEVMGFPARWAFGYSPDRPSQASRPGTGEDEQKGVNLRGNPHVLLLTGCHRWDEGLDVAAEGEAVRVTDETLLTRLASAWAQKWDGQWQFQVHDGRFEHPQGGVALVFEVRPAKVLAFAKGRFGQTRHRFPQ